MKESGKALHRHDISDTLWEKIEALLPEKAGKQGLMAQDNRRSDLACAILNVYCKSREFRHEKRLPHRIHA
ncbi:MAG: hypothetical protein LBO67_03880 [Spirochaetaceae bacterium]|jgi:transposase|nr:hypothetical protein [Spirochaetaceae bacterium]